MVQSMANGVVPEVVERIDVQALVDRVDLDALLDRIDLNALLEKVDVQRLVERIDVDALVERTEMGSVIARTGAGVASKALDVMRSQGVGLDSFLDRWADRLLRRRGAPAAPLGPPLLVHPRP